MFSNAANNSLHFSEEDLRRAIASSEGRQLLSLLRSGDGEALSRAVQAVWRGDYSDAQSVLEPMLRDPEAQKLVEQLKQQQK